MQPMPIAETLIIAWCLGIGLADLYTRRIPNILAFGLGLIAIGWLLLTGQAMLGADWPSVALGVVASLLLTLPAYAARLLGAGDVKCLLVIALLGAWHMTLLVFVIATMLATVFGLAHMLFMRFSSHHTTPKRWIPFGAALSAGLLCVIGIV
ncbi:prepilin peptidase [Methylophilus sp. QUAN]|uniref:prepilin peptidase n=1 Tax=Methylophilus sp. QUAN TaxID=2781020 RepID=UPI0018907B95|nr:prepilin peptidase [Methylophilus sp. QUAN]MBF4992322.1 prepilin peptidase [Methylophilus sp. QUAN]